MALNGQMMDRPLTIGSLIDHAARYHGGTEIVSVEADGDVRCSDWAGVAVNACRLASALQSLGIGTGDRVGTLAWNHQRHLEIYFGVSSAGMICHTINPRLFANQLVYIVRHAANRAANSTGDSGRNRASNGSCDAHSDGSRDGSRRCCNRISNLLWRHFTRLCQR